MASATVRASQSIPGPGVRARRLRQGPARCGRRPNTSVEDSAPGGHCAPLYAAAGLANHRQLAVLMLDRGADPDTPHALYHAALHRDHICLRLLLEHGARSEGTIALGAAISTANTGAVRLLLDAGIDAVAPIPADALCEASAAAKPFRCVKRYIAREIYHLIRRLDITNHSPQTA